MIHAIMMKTEIKSFLVLISEVGLFLSEGSCEDVMDEILLVCGHGHRYNFVNKHYKM